MTKLKEKQKSQRLLGLPHIPTTLMEALNVVQILGHEPITKHTRTPPTEELPQPQLNIWGISSAKDFSVGKC